MKAAISPCVVISRPFHVAAWDVSSSSLITHYIKELEEDRNGPHNGLEYMSLIGVVWSPDGKHILCYGMYNNGAKDIWVHAWNPDNGRQESTYSPKRQGRVVTNVSWSPDSERVAMDYTNEIIIWNGRNGQTIYTYATNSNMLRYTWAPDGKHIASCGFGGNDSTPDTIVLWDASSGTIKATYSSPSLTKPVNVMRYSPDGTRIAISEDSGIIDTLELQ
jgi:WD40 repeat protein